MRGWGVGGWGGWGGVERGGARGAGGRSLRPGAALVPPVPSGAGLSALIRPLPDRLQNKDCGHTRRPGGGHAQEMRPGAGRAAAHVGQAPPRPGGGGGGRARHHSMAPRGPAASPIPRRLPHAGPPFPDGTTAGEAPHPGEPSGAAPRPRPGPRAGLTQHMVGEAWRGGGPPLSRALPSPAASTHTVPHTQGPLVVRAPRQSDLPSHGLEPEQCPQPPQGARRGAGRPGRARACGAGGGAVALSRGQGGKPRGALHLSLARPTTMRALTLMSSTFSPSTNMRCEGTRGMPPPWTEEGAEAPIGAWWGGQEAEREREREREDAESELAPLARKLKTEAEAPPPRSSSPFHQPRHTLASLTRTRTRPAPPCEHHPTIEDKQGAARRRARS